MCSFNHAHPSLPAPLHIGTTLAALSGSRGWLCAWGLPDGALLRRPWAPPLLEGDAIEAEEGEGILQGEQLAVFRGHEEVLSSCLTAFMGPFSPHTSHNNVPPF